MILTTPHLFEAPARRERLRMSGWSLVWEN